VNVQANVQTMLLHPLVATALTAAGCQAGPGYQCVSASYLLQSYHPVVEVELPLLISDLTAAHLPQLQAILRNAYPATHPITVLHTGSSNGNNGKSTAEPGQTTLDALITLSTAAPIILLCVPPLPAGSSFSALQAIVAHLRSPQGCPWDRKQTLQSMRHDLLGECAEVLEAIDLDSTTDNGPHIAEELGDLLMAAVLTVQIAIDSGRFQMAQVMHNTVTKLIRRHPHVFGDIVVEGVETVLANWDMIKAQEKAAKGQTQRHPLDGVPAALPALEKARELQSKAAKAGLLDRAALAQAAPRLATWSATPLTEEDLGEFLWRLVALAHTAGLNAEDALRGYSTRFRATHE
jgi:tetrapyrrole methylase family protein/MazG family protein